jgi:heat shock protein HslJ
MTRWLAVSIGTATLLPGTTIDAEFGDGRVAGIAGCNRYTAECTIDGTAIAVGPVASTRMFCAEPAGMMEQESAFLAALEHAATAEEHGDRLTLRDAAGEPLVEFARGE